MRRFDSHPGCAKWLAVIVLSLGMARAIDAEVATPASASEGFTVEHAAKLRAVTDAEISPDGSLVAYLLRVQREPYEDEDGPAWVELHVVGPEPDRVRPFVVGEVEVSKLRWRPDGAAISYLAERAGDEEKSLWVIPVDGGESRRVLQHSEGISDYSWSPDGKRVAFLAVAEPDESEEKASEKGFKAKVYEEDLEPVRVWIAELQPGTTVEESRMLELEGSASELHWDPSGDRLALALAPTPLIDDHYMRRRVRIVDVASGAVLARIENPGKLGALHWSPDGSHLALLAGADLNDPGEGRLMVASAAGGTPRDLLPHFEGDVVSMSFRTGSEIVFVAHRGVESHLAQVGLDGQSLTTLVAPGGSSLNAVSLSRDGRQGALVADSPRHPGEVFLLALDGGTPRRATDSNPWLNELPLAPQEVVTWQARDGLELEGLLIRPLHPESDRPAPLIVVVHGGPEAHFSDGWLTGYSRPGQFAAARGYAVFYPNYRGSTGRGVGFSKLHQADYAGGEFNDLVDGVRYLVAAGLVDERRVGVTGGSYGGFATAWCATALSEHFAAAVMFVGISDQISKFGTTDIPEEMYLVHARRWPWEDWDWFRERSPVFHVQKARTPILILHGEDDTRVHPSQSLILHRYLKTLGDVPVRLVLYPGEGHGNRKAAARLDYSLRMMRWMDHYLLGPGGTPPPFELDHPAEKLD